MVMPEFPRLARLSSILFAALLIVLGSPAPARADTEARAIPVSSNELPAADRIVVHKSQRKLLLMRGDTILRSYKVALGLNPTGQKEREGDFRTPEGRYTLIRRNPRSDFFLSLQVSYPNDSDIRQARKKGWQPGGAIMIHGLPNTLRHEPEYYETRDWTDGCIAVSNADMVEIWLLTPDNTPIEILP